LPDFKFLEGVLGAFAKLQKATVS